MALFSTNEGFSWFCGAARPEFDTDEAEYSGNVTGQQSDSAPRLRRLCAVSAVGAALHLVFLVVFAAVLVAVKCCPKISPAAASNYRQTFPGHGYRWLAFVSLLFLLACAIGEGVLTDSARPLLFPTQPSLYLADVSALLSTLVAGFYYDVIERCQKPKMAFVSLFYWILCLIGQTLSLWSLIELELSSVGVVRFDLNISLIICYASVIIFDTVILCKWLSCRNSSYNPTSPEEITDEMYYIHDYVSVPSQVTLSWLTRLFHQGSKRPLERKDLGTLPERHTSWANYRQFKDIYSREKSKVNQCKKTVSLFKVVGHFCGIKLLAVGLPKIVSILLKFVTPVAIRGIVLYAAGQNQEKDDAPMQPFTTMDEFISNGYILLFILFIGKLAHIFCLRSVQYYLTIQAVHVRVALQGMVYDKCLRLSMNGGNSKDGLTPGKLVNYMTTDPASLQQMFMEFHSIPAATITIIICMVLLYLLLGFSALLGAASFILVMPVVTLAGRRMASFQKKALHFSDSRLKYCTELLQGMKLIKMYGWEDVFTHTIESIRKQELWAILVKNVFFALSTTISSAVPILMTLISFGTYTLLSGHALTPDIALPALSLFFILENSLFYFPFLISCIATGIVSMRRLQVFLMSSEVRRSTGHGHKSIDCIPCYADVNFQPATKSSVTRKARKYLNGELDAERDDGMGEEVELLERNTTKGSAGNSLPPGVDVKIEQGSFSWESNSDPVLHDINIEIPNGKLTIIVGCVGSGKSSLLSAILGEMTVQSGEVHVSNSDVAYAAQKTWIINASIRENITMGCDLDDTRYQDVTSAAALRPDIEQFPAGDATEIGEKGINLSGGQKQRISLARAFYSAKSIVVMDDPLSALDAHVSRHVVHQGITGLLGREKRTSILVTNQLSYVPLADHVLVMMDGRVKFQGTPNELESSNSCLREMLPQLHDQTDGDDQEDVDDKVPVNKPPDSNEASSREVTATANSRLVRDEERKTGNVSLQVYLYVLRVSGWFLLAWILALFLFNGCAVGRALKLAEWSEAGLTENATSQLGRYIAGYTAWSGAGLASYIISDTARTLAAYFATRNLFRKLLNNVIHLPLRFFDTTPTGRILNRFSSDTNSIDHYLFQNLDAVLFNLVHCVFFIVLNAIIAPTFLIAVLPLGLINALVIRFFLASSREIKRLGSISKSPILACFTQTLNGLSTVRAYGYQQHFMNSLLSRVNENCTMFLYLQASYLWLNIRLDILSAFIVLASGIAALLACSLQGISASLVGLAIAVAARSSNLISYVTRYYGELEIRMNAVERVEFYTRLPTERYQDAADMVPSMFNDYYGIVPPTDWPASGNIEFNNVCARYDITLEPVLCNINLLIKPGEKVGICGRTGSGKSSLTLALLQLIDTHQGSIVIDGFNVSHIALRALRQRLAIIPQDPVLFTGSIRKNLDPADRRTDAELWEALEIAQVKGLVSDLGGLDFQVSEGGDNFSVGQRQLFCLARAFLRKSRILIMDEATASIDLEMDKTLQQVLVAAFQDQTVVTVAHRVETIMNCDTILVMSNGEIIERGSPQQLLADPGSEFASLVQASGGVIT